MNTTNEVNRSLKALGNEYETLDVWIMYMLVEMFDLETRKLWSPETYYS